MTRDQLKEGQRITGLIDNIRIRKAVLDRTITESLMGQINDQKTCEQVDTIIADAQCKITNYITARIQELEEEFKNL